MPVQSDIKFRLEYDSKADVYIAYPCGRLSTEADCNTWYLEYVRVFAPLGRRVDAIFVLDMIHIDAGVREQWMKYREQLHAQYTRHTVRVFLGQYDSWVTKFTSHRDFATDIEGALRLIGELRAGDPTRNKRAGWTTISPSQIATRY